MDSRRVMAVALESMDKLVEEKEDLRADLKAVAVVLKTIRENLFVFETSLSPDIQNAIRKALARDGVKAVLEGVKRKACESD